MTATDGVRSRGRRSLGGRGYAAENVARDAPGRGPARRVKFARRREAWGTQLFLLPIAVVFVALIGLPLAKSVWYSFTDFDGFSTGKHYVGLENYRTVLQDTSLVSGLVFTLMYAVATTVIVTMLAIPLAVVLDRRFVGRNFVRAMFFFPAIPSMAVLGLVWTFVLSPLSSGVINTVLGDLFNVGPVPWLSDNTLARVSVILVGVWAQVGWHAVLYLAYLQSIPGDYYEAALIDGASPRQRFFRITLPLLAPAVTVSTLLLMTGGLRVFDLPYTLTNGGPGYSTYTLTQGLIQRGIAEAAYGQASALAVMFMLLVAVVVAAQFLVTKRLERRSQ
jgi:raffinose/stachyose/melibiose transport system permease protein